MPLLCCLDVLVCEFWDIHGKLVLFICGGSCVLYSAVNRVHVVFVRIENDVV